VYRAIPRFPEDFRRHARQCACIVSRDVDPRIDPFDPACAMSSKPERQGHPNRALFVHEEALHAAHMAVSYEIAMERCGQIAAENRVLIGAPSRRLLRRRSEQYIGIGGIK
jgi:hypothetical protein